MTTRHWLRGTLLAAFVGTMLTVLSACNTMEGAGRDVEAAGDKVQDIAD